MPWNAGCARHDCGAGATMACDNGAMARSKAAWQWVGNHLIEAFAADTVDNAVWDELLEEIAARRATLEGVLVLPGSTVPTATQRARLTEALGGSRVKAAILSTSVLTRTAITALNYFVLGEARAFAPDQLEAALDYLAVPRELRPQIVHAMAVLKDQVAGK